MANSAVIPLFAIRHSLLATFRTRTNESKKICLKSTGERSRRRLTMVLRPSAA